MPDAFAPPPTDRTPGYEPTEVIHVDDPAVSCDGGVGALGHPRVFLRIKQRQTLCPYCSRLFVLNEGAGHASGH